MYRLVLACALLCSGCGRVGFDAIDPDASGDVSFPDGSGVVTGPTDGLVVAYPLDDDPTDGVREVSGSGIAAGCTACPQLESGAYALDGTSWIEVEPDPRLETATGYTVSIWARPGLTGIFQSLVTKMFGTSNLNTWHLSHRPGSGCMIQHFQIETAGAMAPGYDRLNGPNGPVVDGWWHVVATWDGNEAALWINGESVGTYAAMGLFDGGIVRIGTDWDGGSPNHTFVGHLRDFRLYDRALSAAEIGELTATGTVVAPPGSMGVGSVSGFVLVDAATDADIGPLVEGMMVSVPAGGINVRAEVTGTVGAVRFDLDATMGYRLEATMPFALEGDADGDYEAWSPTAGRHTITATPFCDARASGAGGTPLTVAFDVI